MTGHEHGHGRRGEPDAGRALVRHVVMALALAGAASTCSCRSSYVVLISFNDPAGRFTYTSTAFTLDNW